MITKNDSGRGISVIMPTYNQAAFIARAIVSLQLQTFINWELIIINDGSTDKTDEAVHPFLGDGRIVYAMNSENKGLGVCLNMGIENAAYDFIAYLPSDDIYFKDHLQSLFEELVHNDKAVLAYSGLKHHYFETSKTSHDQVSDSQIEGYDVQLVQVLHRKTKHRWIERSELVTDDLYRMFWGKLENQGECVQSKQVTCEWICHPDQRHRIITETGGGIHRYKFFYHVKQPIRFHASIGSLIDEIENYKQFREIHVAETKEKLKILLVGELAYNAERLTALEDKGHQLFGLWIDNSHAYNTIGPFPFGNIEDIPHENWEGRVKEIQPDIIYALLNYRAVPLAHEVLTRNLGIPFVWHFKESGFYCRQLGAWQQLVELYSLSDGQIYINPEVRDWFEQFIPKRKDYKSSFVLDGDLPSKKWSSQEQSPLLSDIDGEIHTLVPGRLIGIHPSIVKELAEQKIHLHFYGDFYHSMYPEWIAQASKLAPEYLHLHSNCTQEDWVKEFSQYDAGWLHYFDSSNNGELMRASWNDLNYPARMATFAIAGVPMLQRNNSGHIVATQSLTQELDIGIFFKDFKELGQKLRDKAEMALLREKVWANRSYFTFDYHADSLIIFFKKIIAHKTSSS